MNENFYETGSTQPPKSRVWMVLLLVTLIFLGGIITALGVLNIKLWRVFTPEMEEAVPLSFSRIEAVEPTQPKKASAQADLGFSPETVSAFHRAYYGLPQGVYIPRVQRGSNAALAGILPGDILLSINGEQVTDTDTLQSIVYCYHPGDTVTLTLYRNGKELSVELVLTHGN
jgi:serine protease Do